MTALQTISISGQTIGIKEYKGQRVVTFKDIDAVHGRKEGHARKRFNDNKKHFVLGRDYFVRNPDEARKEFRITAPNGLTLITESGYLMLVKSFGDDKAWQVQRKLVNSYFRAKTIDTVDTVEKTDFPAAPRTYRDISVMTLRDAAQLSGLPSHAIHYRIHKEPIFKAEADYFILTGDRLRAFKRENPDISRNVSCLLVVTKSGLEKLMPGGRATDTPDVPKEDTEDEKKERKKRYAFDQWEDAPAAFRVLKRLYDHYHDEKYRYPLRNAAWILACNLSLVIFDTGDVMTQFKD